MKPILIVICVILTIQKQAEGGVVKDFLGKVHETAQVVREDVRKVWRPDTVTTTSELPKTDEKPVTTPASVTEDDTKDVIETKGQENNEKKVDADKLAVTEEKDKHVETSTSTATITTVKDEKDGRENFKAGCASGYQRTPDGRCRPTY